MRNLTPKHDLARSYLDRGWHLLLIAPNTKTPINKWRRGTGTHFAPSRLPADREERREYLKSFPATSDPAVVEAWLAEWPDAQLAVDGRVSGLFIVDLDVDAEEHKDGFLALGALCAAYEVDLPDTLRARSPHGEHRFFPAPEGVDAFQRVNLAGAVSGYGGLDIKSNGYVVLPDGSNNREWLNDLEPTPLPSGFVEALHSAYEWNKEAKAAIKGRKPRRAPCRERSERRLSGGQDAARITAEVLQGLLAQLEPEDFGDNDSWVELGMSCYHATAGSDAGCEAFVAWSIRDERYKDDGDEIRYRWDSWGGDGITYRTLFDAVIQAGGRLLGVDEFPDDLPPPSEGDRVRARLDYITGQPTDLTDVGNSRRFVLDHSERIKFADQLNKYLVWDGARWDLDLGLGATALAKRTADSMYLEAGRIGNEDLRNRAYSWTFKSLSAQRIDAMVKLAKPDLVVSTGDLDADPMLLNVQNGTLDLRTYELRPHSPDDLMMKVAPTELAPDAACRVWKSFLDRVLPDEEIRGLFQRLMGYSLQGGQEAKAFALVYGDPDGGKSTAVRACADALGTAAASGGGGGIVTRSYAETTNLDAFAPQQGNRPELAYLMGARLVTVNEIPRDGRRLESSVLKAWTGGDAIAATPKYGHPLQFYADGTVALVGNYLPDVDFDDDAMWERIVDVPFTQHIPEAERDRDLRSKFDPRAILAWMVAGHRQYQERGLDPPEAAREAKAEYRKASDPLGEFWEACVREEPDGWVSRDEMARAYKHWAEHAGLKRSEILSRSRLVRTVNVPDRDLREGKRRGTRGWCGLRVQSPGEEEDATAGTAPDDQW